MPRVEVEERVILADEEYQRLLQFFQREAEHVETVEQETHYLDCEEDLRIQRSSEKAKIWLKKGGLHDAAREELELPFPRTRFSEAREILWTLGYETEIVWLRTRHRFQWNNTTVCLDDTKGYAKTLELERMSSPGNVETHREHLREQLHELGVEPTPAHVFDDKYEAYREEWRNRISPDAWRKERI